MLRRKILKLICPLACTACLAAGYAAAGIWTALPAVLLALLIWLLAALGRSGSFSWAALMLSTGLAAGGLFASVSFPLMVLAATLALAGWDIVFFANITVPDPPAGTARLLSERHYRSLITALGLGLPAALIGPSIRIQIPFVWVLLLAIFAVLSLEGIWRRLRG